MLINFYKIIKWNSAQDPHQFKSGIWIRIQLFWIRHTGLNSLKTYSWALKRANFQEYSSGPNWKAQLVMDLSQASQALYHHINTLPREISGQYTLHTRQKSKILYDPGN